MKLSKRLASDLPAEIRARGRNYWLDRRVRIQYGDRETVEASVAGSRDYWVDLRWEPAGQRLEAECNCRYFQSTDLCKHIWATVLAASDRGFLAEVGAARQPALVASGDEEPGAAKAAAAGNGRARSTEKSAWKTSLEKVRAPQPNLELSQQDWFEGHQLFFELDVEASRESGTVVIVRRSRKRKKDGEWGALGSRTLLRGTVPHLPDPADRQLLSLVLGAQDVSYFHPGHQAQGSVPKRFVLPEDVLVPWVRQAAEAGKLLLGGKAKGAPVTLRWDGGDPWRLELSVRSQGDELRLAGEIARGEDRVSLSEPALLTAAGLVFLADRVAPFDAGGAFAWVPPLRGAGEISIPPEEGGELVEALVALPRPPVLRLPEHLRFEEILGEPKPRLRLRRTVDPWLSRSFHFEVDLEFDYDGDIVRWEDDRPGVFQSDPPRFLRRSEAGETAALDRLLSMGVRHQANYRDSAGQQGRLLCFQNQLPALIHMVTRDDWHLEVEGSLFRTAPELELQVQSGIDWFDLQGEARFDDQSVALPVLLKALAKGETSLRLADGSTGLLPSEWLEAYGSLAQLGTLGAEELRFESSQVGLVDALLAARPEIRFDQAVARARRRLGQFDRIKPRSAPRGFRGELRGYQREGLGWLHFLREFGFGGCLADDMGLGKTVQVLALLEARRARRHQGVTAKGEPPAASLVVVPKSLIFNWRLETERFAPKIRLLDYTGPKRKKLRDRFPEVDVILTTYGVLRRDIDFFSQTAFDYVVLDEAQAIKNAGAATAKAARLLRADHRLALTGTPVENHAGELMSILDFLNPGLFGPGRRLELPKRVDPESFASEDEDLPTQLALVAGAVRPFILRRTKAKVASDLPDKVEQTLYCDLPPKQRKEYDQLRTHYRQTLLGQVDDQGLAKVKMHVLEALLRLRQAACHPGLIDSSRQDEDSAKLDLLLPHLEELIDEGHKALVFSQFTSLLSIVRRRLDARGIRYEYLDGRTRKREPRIQRFQEDPDCSLFLISLKAGGVGLNLTAAEYVFLLDPWWNPAVEAQAIDRAHRIGQDKTVFAYSVIARDTVEEKVLDLQRSKRKLAEALIRADGNLLKNLSRADLEQLLS